MARSPVQHRPRPSDAELVAAARRGERAAFAALVERHRALALSLAGEILGDRHVATDVVQEAAVTAMVGLDRLRTPGKFGSWFSGIALNLARRWWRDARRAGGVPGAVLAPPDGPEDAALRADLAQRVRNAVERLPPGQRDAVRAFYWKGLSHAEAACELGVTPGAVKARLHQARSNLAPNLAHLATPHARRGEVGTPGTERDRKEMPMFADDPSSDNGQWVPVEVDEVVRSRADATSPAFHAVVLRDHGGRRVPIYIGDAEATALAFSLETVETPRPMTYAMASRLVKASGARVTDVRITRLADRTVFAVVTVDTSSGRQEVDARPSDALNLALVASAPVFVESSAFDALASCALREWQHFPDRARDLVSEAQDRHTTVMTLAEAAMRRQDDSEVAPSGRDERQS